MPSRAPIALFALPVLAGSLGLLAACGASGSSSFSGGVPTPPNDAGGALAYAPDEGPANTGPVEAAVEASAPVAAYQGNPLCNASLATGCCYPDGLITCEPTACAPAADAGSESSGGYTQAIYGCHLAPSPAPSVPDAMSAAGVAQVSPACMPAGLGLDGASCHQSNDCAPGYECVGDGTCRHYCCAGNAACRLDQFCDIQQTAGGGGATSMNVPVCVSTRQCSLTRPNACPQGQTCAVVREDGTESCVAVGSATAGQSCETEHCAAGLVCLGATARTCYALCEMVGAGQCPSPQTCKGGPPLFQDPGVGVCQ
jgi:hypothetical protein